ncbi:snare associated Golgi protein-domain-containing protein [Desarmillaria tabescens]|uniref:Snare associated Golgi protein-domain-containing protein n=1 Tax=Armillaria tabescens TaxID=1929756 RepID=A0AA39TS29_ARMTA|nr:snare associated Golgi protein-domain-containing protein [Desarmillaria tabescens]KAK0468477.1 snare associated Golgi protein-domain-containing protein [Desarmillaria tabescens]
MSDSLAPPPLNRNRASSTTLRPALTIRSLGRRRSGSLLQPQLSPCGSPISDPAPEPVPEPEEPVQQTEQSSNMLAVIASRILQSVHAPTHKMSWSTPSTPKSVSEDDYILPLSASAHKTSFGDVLNEKSSSPASPLPYNWLQRLPPVQFPIILVISLFPISTGLVFLALRTLPISFSWPQNLADLAELGRDLHGYSQSGPAQLAHVIGILAITAVWKHAWSIPGSVIWNVLAGALFSPAYATLLLTLLTTIGSTCATLLSKPLAPFLTHFFPKSSGSDAQTSPWIRLSILRLIGVVPWSGINIACGVCGVSIADCVLGAFIGSLPWTAVTCQIGDILQTVASAPSPTPQTVSSLLLSPQIIVKLVFLSFLSLAPILGREHLRAWLSSDEELGSAESERVSRWTWVQEWRDKIRIPSRSRTRERQERFANLAVLVQEKRAMEDVLPS